MLITTQKIFTLLDDISNSKYLSNKKFMIFDIETTGFSREYAIIYMIGCIYKKNDHYEYFNMFAQNPEEECELINQFFQKLEEFQCIIHFNGNKFDIPFLQERAKRYNIKDEISCMESIDIYELIRPFRNSLEFPNLKLDTLQQALGYSRDDLYTGGDLIQVYNNYTQRPRKKDYQQLLLHNKEDVEGMIYLLPLIDTVQLIDKIITKRSFQLKSVDEKKGAIHVKYDGLQYISLNLTFFMGNIKLIFSKTKQNIEFIIPIFNDEKKLFFSNHKDYVYISERDEVVHQSIARFMKGYKKTAATKRNCYTLHRDVFIPVIESNEGMKIFKDDYKDKNKYIIFNQELDEQFYAKQLVAFLKQIKGI